MAVRWRDAFLFVTIIVIVYTCTLIQIRLDCHNLYSVNRYKTEPDFSVRNNKEAGFNLTTDPSHTIDVTKEFALGLSVRGEKYIPKIIHQIWNDEIVPAEFVDNLKSLVRDNPAPDWKYYWWTKDSGSKFIKDKFPTLLEIIKDKPDLMRSDILRYLVIYEYGGVYFDLDTVSVKPLHDFVTSHRCSLAKEPDEHYFATKGRDFLLTNSVLLCIRRHPFYAHLMLHVFIYKLRKDCRPELPFFCTGPAMLSRFFREINKTDEFSSELPDVQTSEVFQDVYDDKYQRGHLDYNCYNNSKLLPYQIKICSNWIARGKEKRNLSERAITYHTWFHIILQKMKTKSDENHITNVIPHAKIYGKDF